MYSLDITPKNNVHTDKNEKITMNQIDKPEYIYFRSNYVIIVDLTVVTEDKFSNLYQVIMFNRDQVSRGGYLTYNKDEIIHHININTKDIISCILIDSQTVLATSSIFPENKPSKGK